MEGEIDFFADVPRFKWVVVKKMVVDESSSFLEVARFLASVHATLHNKMLDFIGQGLDLQGLDKIAADIAGAEWNEKKKEWIVKGRIGEERINKVMARLKSPSLGKEIGKLVKGKSSRELARVYVTRRVFDLLKFPLEPDPKLIEKAIEEESLV